MSGVSFPQRGGDEDALEAFTWFFTAEYPQVVRLLVAVVHDRATAEDLAQDAFVRLHRNWEKVSHYERPDHWVRRVALNLAFSWRRREGRRWGLEGRAVREEHPAGHDTDDRTDDRADVLAAIRQLPSRQRALIALYYLEDRPMAEVAEVMQMTESAAKVAVHRARARLAELLSGWEVTA